MEGKRKYTYLNYTSAYDLIKKIFYNENNFDHIIKRSFDIMGNILDIDLLELNIYHPSYLEYINKHVWKKPGIDENRYMYMNSISLKPTFFDAYKDNDYIKINDTRKIFPGFEDFHKIFKSFHIKSICVLPIKIHDEVVGGVVLKYIHKRKKFTKEQIQFTINCHKLIQNRLMSEYKHILIGLNKNIYIKMIENFIYPVALLDYSYNMIYLNKEFEKFFNITKEELDSKNFIEFISEGERNRIIEVLNHVVLNEKDDHEIFKMINQEKKIIRLLPLPLEKKDVELIAIIFKDVTKFKMKEKELIKMAYYDIKTDLYNRKYYIKICQELNKMDYNSLGIIIFKINNLYKLIQDDGNEKGNEIITNVARYIKIVFNKEFLVSRVSEDEFIVFILNHKESDIRHQINQYNNIVRKQDFYHYISIGYSFTSEKVNEVQTLIQEAETSMFSKNINYKNLEVLQ